MAELDKMLKAFEMHGAIFSGDSGSQAQGNCPFCHKERHFYVNKQTYLWDCKVCSASGNYFSFLAQVHERNVKNIEDKDFQLLSKNRGMPVKDFQGIGLGFWVGQYTLPTLSAEGKVHDIRCYRLGQKFISTSGAKAGLFGLPEMLKSKDSAVYICEGEWDTIAMRALLSKAKAKGVAVCSPGATTFKEEWVEYFKGRKVYACFDNDDAGIKGQELIHKRLAGVAASIRFLHWPEKNSIGYDIRDFYQEVYLKERKPKTALQSLHGLMRGEIKGQAEGSADVAKDVTVVVPVVDTSIGLKEVEQSLRNKMFQPDMDVFKAITAALISTVFDTKPIWLFVVAPPSAGKTEMIMSYRYFGAPHSDLIHYTSSLTEHTLVSGMNMKSDPSLLAQFEGRRRAMFIKDFTPILSYPDSIKLEIFGTFRDAYDGSTSKNYGNGVTRAYNSLRFPIIAGVTPEIYKETANFAALGERFGKVQLRGSDELVDTLQMMALNMQNIGQEVKMDDYHNRVVFSYLSNILSWIEKHKIKLPRIPEAFYSQLSYVSLYAARMRGSVSRDRFRSDLIMSKPVKEKPMRFNLMIATIASYIPLLHFQTEVNQASIDFARKIALDTVNPREEEILRTVYRLNQEYKEAPSEFNRPNRRNIYRACSYTPFTVDRVLQDFIMLDILVMQKTSRQTTYDVTKDMKEILVKGKIYQTVDELNRHNILVDDIKPEYKKSSMRIKIRKKAEVFERSIEPHVVAPSLR